MGILIRLLVNSLAIFITAQLIPGVHIADLYSALIVAIVLGLINTFIKPILLFFTLPITILTLGLFTFVINALLIMFVSNVVKGFQIPGFWAALIFSIILSIISGVLTKIVE